MKKITWTKAFQQYMGNNIVEAIKFIFENERIPKETLFSLLEKVGTNKPCALMLSLVDLVDGTTFSFTIPLGKHIKIDCSAHTEIVEDII